MSPFKSDSLILLVDSSTRPTKRGNKYGESTVCWGIFNKDNSILYRLGILYCNYEGPNKAFYIGIIKSLEDCKPLIGKDCSISIRGDCEPVINQLLGKRNIVDLKNYYDVVKSIESQINIDFKISSISYEHISEDDPCYKKIDRIAKEAHKFIKIRLNKSKN